MITGWRYWYRRYFGCIPIQFCMTCGRWYWGGLPRWWIVKYYAGTKTKSWQAKDGHYHKEWSFYRYRVEMTWQAAWKDYCSQECCDGDPEVLAMDAAKKSKKS